MKKTYLFNIALLLFGVLFASASRAQEVSVPLGFGVEKWSWLEPIAIDFITNHEYGTGIVGATIRNAASDGGEVLLWRYSADGEELITRIPAKLVNAVPTVRFDQTGLFDNKLFVAINAGPDGRRTTRVVIVEPNGEFRDAISIYDGNTTQASIEFSNQPSYPEGVYIYDADIGQGQSFYWLDTSFNLHRIASHTIPSGRNDIDPMDLKADPTGKYGGLLTLSDTDLNHDGLSGLYQLQADGTWQTLVAPADVSEHQFQGIAFSNAGPLGSALYVADAAMDNIWVVSPRGAIEAFAIGFAVPKRLAIGPEGTDMWVADQTGLYRIFATDPSDRETPTATPEPTLLSITAVEVTVLGTDVAGLIVEFARAIAGRQPDYAYGAVTDAGGRAALTITSADRVSGFYQARARNVAGEVVGLWNSIPLNEGRRQSLELTLGGEVRVVAVERLDAVRQEEERDVPELIAHYPFNGNARDVSGNEYHGTLSGPVPTWDRFGNEDGAILFYGTNHRIDLPHKVLNGRLDVSTAFWLKTSKSGAQTIVSGANQLDDNEHVVFLLNERLLIFFSHGRVESKQGRCDIEIQPIADGTWHHFAVVRNGSLGYADFFVDGEGYPKRCGHLVYNALKVEAGGLILGQDQDAFGGGFDAKQVLRGALDDLRIYDGTLSAIEVQALMRESNPNDPGAAKEVAQQAPLASGLEPNYPNPFNASTQISYRLATPGLIRLEIYNALGQSVRTLVDELQAAGSYQVRWDARDQRGVAVAAGVYLSRLHYPGGVQTRRLLLLK